jgi:hypothetical protein
VLDSHTERQEINPGGRSDAASADGSICGQEKQKVYWSWNAVKNVNREAKPKGQKGRANPSSGRKLAG